MKRMAEMSNESSPSKRSRSAGDVEIRLLIQSKTAGSIIGKGGSNISRLRSENPATITIPDCPGPERVLSINGPDSAVSKILEEVIAALDEASQKSGEADIRLLVHQSQAGAIIGKAGAKVRELRDLCGGQVKVFSNCCPQSTDRVIQVLGDQQRVVLTVLNILDCLKDSSVKGLDSPYSPYNYDEYYAQEYGGWGEGPKGRFPPMGGRGPMPPMGGPGGHMGGRGPMGGPGPMGPSGGMGHFGDRLNDRRRGGGGSGGGGGGGGNMFGNPRGGMPIRDEYDDMMGGGPGMGGKNFLNGNDLMSQNGDCLTTSTQVTIPKDAAGAIIGKGGARIRKIRADSCCSISIEDARPGSNDRIITITGTDQQIKHAQYLLQQSVREFGGPAGGRRNY